VTGHSTEPGGLTPPTSPRVARPSSAELVAHEPIDGLGVLWWFGAAAGHADEVLKRARLSRVDALLRERGASETILYAVGDPEPSWAPFKAAGLAENDHLVSFTRSNDSPTDSVRKGISIIVSRSDLLSEQPARPVRHRVREAKLDPRGHPAGDVIRWTCPHGLHAGKGCVACYHASAEADPALPLWRIAVWFTTERPVPIRVLKDVRRHGRRFALDQPSTPLVYLLSGQARAATSAEAVAGLVGFLLGNRNVVDAFIVTEIRAVS
jgi:hypothetical protein